MRYFFFLPGPESPLASCIVVPALACQTVARAGPMQALPASDFGALTGAVDVTPVAVTTDKDLAVAIVAGTVVKAGAGQHRHEKADEGLDLYLFGCDTVHRLCESTVWGMASVLTAKSWPALCLIHQPFPHTAIAPACHLLVRLVKAIDVLRIGDLGAPKRNDRNLAKN